jgi:hypothetical protein
LLDWQVEQAESSKCCMQATQAFGDTADHTQEVKDPILFIVKKAVCNLEVICHRAKTILYPRPQLMFVCNPGYMIE